ncbi:ABC transporter permease [Paenibacillus medicaginis]|uniref:ABC transporter permease n=1 Tax=Paenibacillus medicaginis TaxID=1470560 RepID=A0ABV5C286_9BACL
MMKLHAILREGAGDVQTGSLLARIAKHRTIYLLVLPGLLFFLIFKIAPMWGLLLAFKDYNPFLGFAGSEWVGVKHFVDLFASSSFYIMLRNTLAINIIALVFQFPLPILLALMLNEIRHESFKRFNQSIVYLPHFLSWVVVASMTFFLLSTDVGIVNKLIAANGGETISFLSDPNYFWGLLTAQVMWKEAGWGTIIFLAAMAGVDPQRYEAAVVDGAGRFRQIWHITLPAIRPTIIILLILRLGSMFDTGFEQILLMMNPLVRNVGEVFDTYSYTYGILQGKISIGVTVGLFKGLVGLVLIVLANRIVKRLGHEGIY